jgi:capsular polysaccharide biosynthesis protein
MVVKLKALLKKYPLAALRKVKVWRQWSLVPRGAVRLSGLLPGIIKGLKVYPAIKRVPPLTIDANLYWKFEQLLRDMPQPTFVVEGRGWRVWGNQGAVITDSDDLFMDVSREFEKPGHSIFQQLQLEPLTELKGTSAVVTASGCDMYYHWMFDVLPRIQLLKDRGFTSNQIDRYIIDYRDISFQKESIKALGIPVEKISRSNDHFKYHIRAEHLLVPSLPSKLDVVSAGACQFLRNTFFDPHKKSKFGKKIYLKRSGKRVLINAKEIEAELKAMGFETVECEKFSINEQAAIFYNADIVIGAHGAAFSNVVFCKPGAKVIEFFSPRWINPCYWTICNHVSATYYYIIGEGEPPGERSDARGTNADIELSLYKLRKLFHQFEILE